MTADPQAPISDFTEMTDGRLRGPMAAFLRALLAGTLAGGLPMLVFSLPLASAALEGGLETWAFALMPIWITAIITLAAMLIIGLSLTAVLHRFSRECWHTYTACGVIFGAAIPFLTLLIMDGSWESGLFFAAPGALAGTACGFVWGRWRRAVAAAKTPSDHPTNPYHDMIY